MAIFVNLSRDSSGDSPVPDSSNLKFRCVGFNLKLSSDPLVRTENSFRCFKIDGLFAMAMLFTASVNACLGWCVWQAHQISPNTVRRT